jgi:MoxR-like ATPase
MMEGNVSKTYSSILAGIVRSELSKVIVGLEEAVDTLLIALLTGGHILIEGVPGLAKTMLAKAFSLVLGVSFRRIQFTSDILPSDILGGFIFNRKTSEFEFRPGPIFANILLADEINRAPPRSQSALLEAMQERQVTVEGQTYQLPDPFLVLATQNPIELEGTYPLPEAEIDRFMMRVNLTYPSQEQEKKILALKNLYGDILPLNNSVGIELIEKSIEEVKSVKVHPDILDYIVQLVGSSRRDSRLVIGASPRAEIALLYAAKARAAMGGRTYIIPDDVKRSFFPVINHRLILKPEYTGLSRIPNYSLLHDIVSDYLAGVEVPW